MAIDRSKFIATFVEEAGEHLGNITDLVLSLEKKPDNEEILNSAFRAVHTVKGSSRMLKFKIISDLAHAMENVLGALRKKELTWSGEMTSLLLRGVDILSEMLDSVSAGEEISTDISDIVTALGKALENKPETGDPPLKSPGATNSFPEKYRSDQKEKEPAPSETQIEPKGGVSEKTIKKPSPGKQKISDIETLRIKAVKLDGFIKQIGEVISYQLRLKHIMKDIKEIAREAQRNLDVVTAIGPDREGNKSLFETALTLRNKTKELYYSYRDELNVHEIITRQLQEESLSMRMVPLSTVLDTFKRPVRDTADSLDKKAELIVEGAETELDKKIIEKIGDSLLHMVRNSVDHGIEAPETRIRAGKPETGVIKITALHEGANVTISITDDGAGISTDKIKERAIARKLFDHTALEYMSREEILNLIFYPGFSTSKIITDYSGRGVGMDVVKKNIIEDLRGSVKIETSRGKGTSFIIILPVTLAVMGVMLVAIRDRVFSMSNSYIKEIITADSGALIDVAGKKALRFRKELIPVEYLGALLGLGENDRSPDELLIVLVQSGNEKMGIIVDSLVDEEQMVIKSLPAHLKGIRHVSGVAVSGANELLLLINVPEIISVAKEMSVRQTAETTGKRLEEEINILVIDDSVSTREIEKNILEAYGYKVTLAGDGLEGMEKAGQFKYDLIVTDIEMPRLDGFSLTEKLREDEEYKDTPIIIVTSRESREDRLKGIQCGASAYIVKGSFDQSNLLDTIRNLI